MAEMGIQFAQGVGSRLSAAKSATYQRAVGRVEARANPFIARYMLASDLAYALSAGELGVTPEPSARALVQTALDLLAHAETLTATSEAASVDIVVQREAWFIERLGPGVGAWLHLGRNRGESQRSYLPRLFFRHVLHEERRELLHLLQVLLDRAEPVLDALAPNYHHLQHAGYTTLGEYLLSWATTFRLHVERLEQADARLDYAPTVLTSRGVVKELAERVSRRLGFTRRATLRREAMWTEDQFAEPFFVLVLISVDLARLAEDLRLWMTTEFGLFELADQHAAGSSALPQKKNPFGLEAVIGGAAMGAGRLAGQLAANVTPSDQSDALFHAGSLYQHALDVVAWTTFLADVVAEGTFQLDELRRKAALGYAGTSEAHDALVFDLGVPFRIAHRALGALVRAQAQGQPSPDLAALIEAEMGQRFAVDQPAIEAIIRGSVVPPTALDLPLVHSTWAELMHSTRASAKALPAMSAVERAIAALIDEAEAWLAPKGAPLPGPAGGPKAPL